MIKHSMVALYVFFTAQSIFLASEMPLPPVKATKKESIGKSICQLFTEEFEQKSVLMEENYRNLMERIERVGNEDAEIIVFKQDFDDFIQLKGSQEGISIKRAKLMEMEIEFTKINKKVLIAERKFNKKVNSQSNEENFTLASMGHEKNNEAQETKANAIKKIAAEKDRKHRKLTRPGAHGPNTNIRREINAQEKREELLAQQRPFKDVVFEKLAKGKIPPAAMQTVVLIRNILRKSPDKAHVLEELNKFEKDLDFKEIDPNYINLPQSTCVYQVRISDRYRVIIAFELDLLLNNTILVIDPHN